MKQKEVDEIFAPRPDEGEAIVKVDEYLRIWAEAQMHYDPGLGYPKRDASCRDSISSVQWQDTDEVIDERVKGGVVQTVGGAVDSLTDPMHRAVIWVVYANSVGPSVWRNGQFRDWPVGRVLQLHRSALLALMPLLRRRGLLV